MTFHQHDFPTTRRQHLEQMIEIAIALLDAIDGDPDLEETGDLEPYLAWVGAGPGVCCTDGDREDDECDKGEPEQDDEPSLGWTDEEAEKGTGYAYLASRLPFIDGEICAGDEPEFEDEHGAAQEANHSS